MSTDELLQFCRRALIGAHQLKPAQYQALRRLCAGEHTLCVMATGRGKSLIFQVFALMLALKHEGTSIFVYPLRALLADQYMHLKDVGARFGVAVSVLCGETDEATRQNTYAALACGEVDIVLTTPEFLSLHAARFAAHTRFVVFDEAHHLAAAKRGSRTAYADMPRVLRLLGNPCVLAVSATVSNAAASEIMQLLSIHPQNVLADPFVRTNLQLVDHRVSGQRDEILTSIVASSQKTIIYVYSRGAAQALTSLLRHRLPSQAAHIAFYHAGLAREKRSQIEQAFRTRALTALVATSAFGEGVNVGDVDAVVMYGLVPSLDDFNQMSGRAGRSGQVATIYTLYELEDIAHLQELLRAQYPSADELHYIYSELRAHSSSSDNAQGVRQISQSLDVLSREIYKDADMPAAFRISQLKAALAIFSELKICSYTLRQSRDSLQERDFCDICMTNAPVPVMLEQSLYYCEAQRALDAFSSFCSWAFTASEHELLTSINTPIYPSFAHIVGEESHHGC